MKSHIALALGALVLGALLPVLAATSAAHADTAAAQACAATLPKDAKTIFDATLPQVGPGVDLKAAVTAKTRSLAMAGTIAFGTARDSATEAGACLKRAEP